jgi:hypothetical protein
MDEVVCGSSNVPEENLVEEGKGSSSDCLGLIQAECRFPARFFNTLNYTVDVSLQYRLGQRPEDINERNILSFTVHSLSQNGSSWILFPGSVHPELSWKTSYTGIPKKV